VAVPPRTKPRADFRVGRPRSVMQPLSHGWRRRASNRTRWCYASQQRRGIAWGAADGIARRWVVGAATAPGSPPRRFRMGTGIMAARVMVRVEGAGQDCYMPSGWARSGVWVRIGSSPGMGPVGSMVTVSWWLY
jgi:hypothetical protein